MGLLLRKLDITRARSKVLRGKRTKNVQINLYINSPTPILFPSKIDPVKKFKNSVEMSAENNKAWKVENGSNAMTLNKNIPNVSCKYS